MVRHVTVVEAGSPRQVLRWFAKNDNGCVGREVFIEEITSIVKVIRAE